METVWSLCKNLKIELPQALAIHSGHLSKEKEDINLKRYLHYHVHSSIIYNGQDIETACVQPKDKWINYNIYNIARL